MTADAEEEMIWESFKIHPPEIVVTKAGFFENALVIRSKIRRPTLRAESRSKEVAKLGGEAPLRAREAHALPRQAGAFLRDSEM